MKYSSNSLNLLGNRTDINHCVDERGQYNGDVSFQDEVCADWFDIYDQNQANATLSDMLNLDNFPDSSYSMAGNKCRYLKASYLITIFLICQCFAGKKNI